MSEIKMISISMDKFKSLESQLSQVQGELEKAKIDYAARLDKHAQVLNHLAKENHGDCIHARNLENVLNHRDALKAENEKLRGAIEKTLKVHNDVGMYLNPTSGERTEYQNGWNDAVIACNIDAIEEALQPRSGE